MNRHLKHKGYKGSIEFSKEDNIFFGKVSLRRDTVLYEGENIKQLTKSFEIAVEDYLEFCSKKDINPDKPFKKNNNK